jgi:hypothetical protein
MIGIVLRPLSVSLSHQLSVFVRLCSLCITGYRRDEDKVQGDWFWEILAEDFNNTQRGQVLQFVTGSAQVATLMHAPLTFVIYLPSSGSLATSPIPRRFRFRSSTCIRASQLRWCAGSRRTASPTDTHGTQSPLFLFERTHARTHAVSLAMALTCCSLLPPCTASIEWTSQCTRPRSRCEPAS